MKRSSKVVTALTLSAGLALTACAPTAGTGTSSEGGDGAKTVNVGIVYSKTGPLAAYGDAYYEGLQAGLDYATDGTNKVGDTELNITYHDDGGDPDKAVTVAKELDRQGLQDPGGNRLLGDRAEARGASGPK